MSEASRPVPAPRRLGPAGGPGPEASSVADAAKSMAEGLTVQQFSAVSALALELLTHPDQAQKLFGRLEGLALGLPEPKVLLGQLVLVAQGSLRRSLNADQIQEELQSLGLSKEKSRCFLAQWEERRPLLARAALGRALSINQLVDLEWKFGVTTGSSEVAALGSIFLQLKLVLRKGTQLQNVYLELTLPQFYNFLHEMERAKASLDSFL